MFDLQHARPKESGDEDVKFIGVYPSRPNAEAAVARLRLLRDWPEEFSIDGYELDDDHRTDGFEGSLPLNSRDDG